MQENKLNNPEEWKHVGEGIEKMNKQKLVVCKNGKVMNISNLGKKTKQLWKDSNYREHMSNAHKGQKAWNKGLPINKQMAEIINKKRKSKISKTLKEKYKSGERNPWNEGIPMTQEARLKQSLSIKKAYDNPNTKLNRGDKHIHWKGGISKLNSKRIKDLESRIWREKVFQRDNYTCQKCDKRGGQIQADHIKRWCDYPDLRLELTNGQTLCIDCHRIKTAKENSKC